MSGFLGTKLFTELFVAARSLWKQDCAKTNALEKFGVCNQADYSSSSLRFSTRDSAYSMKSLSDFSCSCSRRTWTCFATRRTWEVDKLLARLGFIYTDAKRCEIRATSSVSSRLLIVCLVCCGCQFCLLIHRSSFTITQAFSRNVGLKKQQVETGLLLLWRQHFGSFCLFKRNSKWTFPFYVCW